MYREAGLGGCAGAGAGVVLGVVKAGKKKPSLRVGGKQRKESRKSYLNCANGFGGVLVPDKICRMEPPSNPFGACQPPTSRSIHMQIIPCKSLGLCWNQTVQVYYTRHHY